MGIPSPISVTSRPLFWHPHLWIYCSVTSSLNPNSSEVLSRPKTALWVALLLTDWLTHWLTVIVGKHWKSDQTKAFRENLQRERLATFQTFDQCDEETWPHSLMARRGMKVWGTCNHTFREQPQRDLRTLRHLWTTISTFIVNNIRNSCEVLLNPTFQSRNVFSYAGYRQYFAQLAALRDKWFFIIVFSSWAAAVLWQSPRFLVPLLTKKSSQGEREVPIDKCWNCNFNSMKDFFYQIQFPAPQLLFLKLNGEKKNKITI